VPQFVYARENFEATDLPGYEGIVSFRRGEMIIATHDAVRAHPDMFTEVDPRADERARIRSMAAGGGGGSVSIEAGADFNIPAPGGGSIRDRALRANERSTLLPEVCREHMERQLRGPQADRTADFVVATSEPDYLTAYGKWLREKVAGRPSPFTDAERAAWLRVQQYEERSMNLGSVGAGAALVPYALDPNVLIASAGSVDPMRRVSRVDTTPLNEKKYVTTLGSSASWDAEETEVSDDSPPLLQPSIVCKKAQTFVPISFELAADSSVVEQLGQVFADSKLQLEATAFTLGTGSATEPKGIITAISAVGGSVVNAAGGVLVNTDIYANQNALPARWRPNARFMANLTIINDARRLLKATGLTESIVDDTGPKPRMLGWDVEENSNLDGVIAAGNDYVLLSGDFRQYVILDRLGTQTSVIPHLVGAARRPTAQTGVHMYWRVGADALIPDAFRLTNYNA
jgi:HK97 family phage major capsid protein